MKIDSPENDQSGDADTLHRSRSAERVLQLLDSVVCGGPMTLTDAAAAAELPPSTALRHLRVLTGRGFLGKDEAGRYSSGPTLLRLALAAFRAGPYARLTAAAQPALEELVEATEESAYLAVRDGTEAVYIATVESPRAIRHVGWVGQSVPVAGTAVGQALTSRPDADEPLPLFFNTGSLDGDVSAIVAPVIGTDGVVASISLLGPADRLSGERLDSAAAAVIQAAQSTASSLATPSSHAF